jgi:hypothetical protein
MLPASVARFRIWTDPTYSAASDDVGHRRERAESQVAVGFADLAIELPDPLHVHDDLRS